MDSLGLLLWLQSHRTHTWNVFFLFFSYIGDVAAYLLVIPILYWVVDRRLFFRVLLLLVISGYLNKELKTFFQLPRPYEVYPDLIFALGRERGLGFPSGHAQSAACLWSYLAWRVRRPWMYALAAAMILLVSFSRLYLGSHWAADVVGGIGIGALLALAFIVLDEWQSRLTAGRRLLIMACVTAVTSAVFAVASLVLNIPDGLGASGVIPGLVLGWLLGSERVKTVALLTPIRKSAVCIVGLAGVGGLYLLSKRFTASPGMTAGLGFLTGVWIVWIVPSRVQGSVFRVQARSSYSASVPIDK